MWPLFPWEEQMPHPLGGLNTADPPRTARPTTCHIGMKTDQIKALAPLGIKGLHSIPAGREVGATFSKPYVGTPRLGLEGGWNRLGFSCHSSIVHQFMWLNESVEVVRDGHGTSDEIDRCYGGDTVVQDDVVAPLNGPDGSNENLFLSLLRIR